MATYCIAVLSAQTVFELWRLARESSPHHRCPRGGFETKKIAFARKKSLPHFVYVSRNNQDMPLYHHIAFCHIMTHHKTPSHVMYMGGRILDVLWRSLKCLRHALFRCSRWQGTSRELFELPCNTRKGKLLNYTSLVEYFYLIHYTHIYAP